MFTGVFNLVDVLEISCAGTKILHDLQIVIIVQKKKKNHKKDVASCLR